MILTVLAKRSQLSFKRQAASEACFALLARPLEIFRMVRAGAKAINLIVAKTFPLAEAAEALRYLVKAARSGG